jgi:hypothetical protein
MTAPDISQFELADPAPSEVAVRSLEAPAPGTVSADMVAGLVASAAARALRKAGLRAPRAWPARAVRSPILRRARQRNARCRSSAPGGPAVCRPPASEGADGDARIVEHQA